MTNEKHIHPEAISSYVDNLSFAVVGLARNCENSIRADVYRIREAIGNSKSIVWLIVESDSSDQTVSELQNLKSEITKFNYVTLGNLATNIPKRTDRISFCRNYYAEQIRTNKVFSAIDYVIVADLDGINTLINRAAFESCWKRKDWDMCSANQKGPYYDIWALRHKDWSAEDCWAQYRFLNKHRLDFQTNIFVSVYSKMITIPEDSEWIEVDSAFGGFVIYKKSAFNYCEYIGINEAGEEFCEHTHFHKKLKDNGAKLFINPQLINAELTEHSGLTTIAQETDTPILYQYKDFTIKLPANHLLPTYQKQHLKYHRFLPHLAKYATASDTIVDIGANVGDTLAGMVEKNPNSNYICIEPDQVFYRYLEENIERIKISIKGLKIQTIKALVGKNISNVSLDGKGRTKHAVISNEEGIKSLPLDEMLSNESNIRILKSDVDGFDYDVLDSSMTAIESHKPIVFFECEYHFEYQKSGYSQILKSLESVGYCDWTVFDNFGEVVIRTTDISILNQLMDYVWQQHVGKTTRTIYYFDILAVQKTDSMLINKVLSEYN
ncbi:MAG: FkbM family methyltransferase [Methylococcaceae bacterium]